ncbi:hypothetical protein GCM10027270_23400 [Nocardioides ginkgobilobae]
MSGAWPGAGGGAGGARPRRRGRLGWVLVLLFVGMPLLELYVLIQVGQVIGAWWTIALLVLASVVGAAIVRREGARAWRALVEALTQGRMPHRELADGALVLIGGTLLLTPGFATDLLGALLVLPLTRPVFRGLLARVVASRLLVVPGGRFPGFPRDAGRPGPVVRGDVVDPDEGPQR